MARLRIALLLGMICFAAGCSTKYWYQEDKTFEQCYSDHRACYDKLETLSNPTQLGKREMKIIEDCMKSKGYRLIAEDRLPYPTRSLRPDRTIHYRLRGIAGRPGEE